ncbi:DnaJ Heat shock protein [Phytophthora megakarya]|uniref:DnaJ Heat shock protein n=1 Tax=Phytophthora megakarya TaxID=4795 RepID=A0A225X0B6_9STRA|nr:DnaJ Heat shock protein [Phytophthora megakarya]
MPISNKPGERGDLRINFDIAFPRHLTTLQKMALAKILG